MEISNIQPAALWRNFDALTRIPRPSKHEERVLAYIEEFAQKHNLSYKKDQVGNLAISKSATPGYENVPGVILQAHVDMVPQKNTATVHNFETDPIKTYVDGDWVKAQGTTLGADNGIGVAAALAILETENIQHGPIEVLLTIDEETGMTGAFNLQPGFVSGSILMNLDTEDEGELCIGCAGGLNTTLTSTYISEPVLSCYNAYKLSLTGLKGGHSGVDIHLGRGNANKILNRFLWTVSQTLDIRIESIDAGNLRNAIPREAFATIVVPITQESKLLSMLTAFNADINKELSSVEPDFKFVAEAVEAPLSVMPKDAQIRLLNLIYSLPNGVIRMCSDFEGVVETSTNLAIVRVCGGKVEVKCLLRSSVESAKNDLANAFTSLGELAGYTVEHEGSYPGWKPDPDSKILGLMQKIYQDMFNDQAVVRVVHAGLECGIIGDVYAGLDMISFGPTIKYPHSPDEKVQISTVQKFWDYLLNVLQKTNSIVG